MKKYFLVSILSFCMLLINAANHSITTVGNTFSPANITINQGDTVTWTNGGGFHNVNGTLINLSK